MRRLQGTQSQPRHRLVVDSPERASELGDTEVNYIDLDLLLRDFGLPTQPQSKFQLDRSTLLKGILEQLSSDLDHLKSVYEDRLRQERQSKQKSQKEEEDVLDWLNLPTKHPNLKSILRAKLIKLLSEEGNMVRVSERLLSAGHSSTKVQKSVTATTRFSTTSQKTILTSEFLCNLPESHNEDVVGKTFDSGFTDFKFGKNSQEVDTILMRIKAKKRQAILKLDSENQLLNKYRIERPLTSRWTAKDEESFQSQRKSAKLSTARLVPSSSLRDCGLIGFVRKHLNSESTKEFRDKILAKWMDGHPLSVPELRFIAYTSDSLRNLVDRQFFQSAVNKIDPELIDDLEMLLAEEILHGYWVLRDHAQQQRVKYFRKLNTQSRRALDEQKRIANQLQSSKETLFRRIKSQKAAKFNCLHRLMGNQTQTTPLATSLIATSKQANSVFFGKLDIKEYRSRLHPNSKLLINLSQDKKEEPNLNAIEADKGLDRPQLESAYRVITTRDRKLIDPKSFAKVYSTGPINPNAYPTRELKTKAAIVIQKYVRSRLARRECIRLRNKKADQRAQNKVTKRTTGKFVDLEVVAPVVQSKSSQPASPAGRRSPKSLKSLHSRNNSIEQRGQLGVQQSSRPQSSILLSRVRASLMAPVSEGPLPQPVYSKQRFLMNCAKRNRLDQVEKSIHTYFPKDVNVADVRGNTPLYYAAESGSKDFCSFLISKGALINHKCEGQRTALHVAFQSGSLPTCLVLIQSGANLDLKDADGLTPVAYGCPQLLGNLGLKEGIAYSNALTIEKSGNQLLFKEPRVKRPPLTGFAVSCLSAGMFLSKPPPKPKVELADDTKGGFI